MSKVTWDFARARVNAAKAAAQGGCMPCRRPAPAKALAVSVEKIPNGSVGKARVRLIANGLEIEDEETDATGEIVFFPVDFPEVTVMVSADWFLPEPMEVRYTLADNEVNRLKVHLTELRYDLHVDDRRLGRIDTAPALQRNSILPWTWGANGRGPIVLCNSDHDDVIPPPPPLPAGAAAAGVAAAVAAPAPRPLYNMDASDAVINGGNDAEEMASFAIRRLAAGDAALVPEAGARWNARLEIVDPHADKVHIFDSDAAATQRLLGVGAGAGAAGLTISSRTFPIRVVPPGAPRVAPPAATPAVGPLAEVGLPALAAPVAAAAVPAVAAVAVPAAAAAPVVSTMPDKTFWMEAVTYPGPGFDGLVTIKLTVSKTSCVKPYGEVSYFAGAQFRVAPFLLPNNCDRVSEVFVSDLGPFNAGVLTIGQAGVEPTGNSDFINRLTNLLQAAAAGNPRPTLTQHASADRWMQDGMVMGYSVAPSNGNRGRRRIDAAMATYRNSGDALPRFARSLVAADVGFIPIAEAAKAKTFLDAYSTQSAYNVAYEHVILTFNGGPSPRTIAAAPLTAAAAQAFVGAAARVAATAIQNKMREDKTFEVAGPHLRAAAEAAINGLDLAQYPRPNAATAAKITEAATKAADEVNVLVRSAPTFYDSGGNMQCTPPCNGYPMGRIYFGARNTNGTSVINETVRQFLEAQRVQRPIPVDTSWLEIGHADEMLCFLPTRAGSLYPWVLLVPSPKEAYEIIKGMAGQPNQAVLPNRRLRIGGNWRDVSMTVGALQPTILPGPDGQPVKTTARKPAGALMTRYELYGHNNDVQAKIDAVVQNLTQEIGLNPAQVIHVPVLFMPASSTTSHAMTGNMVNMLVVNNSCIIPKAFGPVRADGRDAFEKDLIDKLTAATPDLTLSFEDDWYTYHMHHGEIHCATNALRRPPAGADLTNWLGNDAKAAWWHFGG